MPPCLPFQWHQVWLNKCGRHVCDSSLHQHWHQILLMNSPLGPYFFLYSSTWTRRKVKMRDRKMEEYEKIQQQKVLHLSRAQTPLFINTEVLGALLPGLQERRISLDNGTRCMNFISLSRIVTTWILSLEQIWIFKCSGKAWFLRNFQVEKDTREVHFFLFMANSSHEGSGIVSYFFKLPTSNQYALCVPVHWTIVCSKVKRCILMISALKSYLLETVFHGEKRPHPLWLGRWSTPENDDP